MNQREEAAIAERIQQESAAVAAYLAEMDALLNRVMQIRAEMKLSMSRIETLQSTLQA